MKDPIQKRFNLQPGIYRVRIVDGSYEPKTRHIKVEVSVVDGPSNIGQDIPMDFYIPKTHFLFNKLCLAVGKDSRNEDVRFKAENGKDGIIGLESFMAVRKYIELTENGEIRKEINEPFDFFKIVNGNYPAMLGDPKRNGGEPSHAFLKENVVPVDDFHKPYDEIPIPIQL